jgi:hypothetical protein
MEYKLRWQNQLVHLRICGDAEPESEHLRTVKVEVSFVSYRGYAWKFHVQLQ